MSRLSAESLFVARAFKALWDSYDGSGHDRLVPVPISTDEVNGGLSSVLREALIKIDTNAAKARQSILAGEHRLTSRRFTETGPDRTWYPIEDVAKPLLAGWRASLQRSLPVCSDSAGLVSLVRIYLRLLDNVGTHLARLADSPVDVPSWDATVQGDQSE